jgi:hypothetical protein
MRPLASREIVLPPYALPPGWRPFARFDFYGPTEMLSMSGGEFAEAIRPFVPADALFFLDTSIFSSCTSPQLWDLLLSKRIIITPYVWIELSDWMNRPAKNHHIRDLVQKSADTQRSLGGGPFIENPSREVAAALRSLTIELRVPDETYVEHGYDYYGKLLSLRKLIGPQIARQLEQKYGKLPDGEFKSKFHAVAQASYGERGYNLAMKGLERTGTPNLLADEHTVVMAVLTAILEGRDVYVVTKDKDIPDQLAKLFLLIKEHYRAMLAAEQYANDPDSMAFREVPVRDVRPETNAWIGETILQLRLSEKEFDILPREFRSVVIHCIHLSRDETAPWVSYSYFTMDTQVARVLRVKATTGGLSTDRFGDRNCTIGTGRLTPQHHEVIVSIGKEMVIPVENWGSFGVDDVHHVLKCSEQLTCLLPIQSP